MRKFLLALLLFLPMSSQALEYSAILQMQGFLGETAAGVGLIFAEAHSMEITVGSYDRGEERFQLNVGYRYLPIIIKREYGVFKPLGMGAYILTSNGRGLYFFSSPDQYPDDNYYEQTAVRLALSLSLAYSPRGFWEPLELLYHVTILDSGIVAIYNNQNDILPEYWASGVMLKWAF